MPTVQAVNETKVLVTGANGFIASWIIRTLLEKGYSVRGTVRTAEKGKYLVETYAKYGDRFEIFVVDDMSKEGAFDEAVKGVHAIEHTASPVNLDVDDPQDILGPAVKGTVGILQSAIKNGGSSIRRIVVTSSCAAILHFCSEPTVFSELDWNEQAIEMMGKLGKTANGAVKYCASKTLAEKAAWDLYNENKNSIGWELVVIHPPHVIGPIIHEVSSVSALNYSVLEWYNTVVSQDMDGKSLESLAKVGNGGWADVRDVAEAHVLALEKEAAGGERIIVSAGSFVWQEWMDVANSINPSPIPSHTLPKGVPGAGADAVYLFQFDTTKQARILGIKFRSKEDSARDLLEDFERRGW